jgi:hypothetical protein
VDRDSVKRVGITACFDIIREQSRNYYEYCKISRKSKNTDEGTKIKVKVRYLMMVSIPRPHMEDDRMINECGTVGGMRIGRGNGSTRRKPAPMQLISDIKVPAGI